MRLAKDVKYRFNIDINHVYYTSFFLVPNLLAAATMNRKLKMTNGAITAHATTAQNIHAPNVLVVCNSGFVLIESINSDTLQLGREVYLEGRSMKKGISAI